MFSVLQDATSQAYKALSDPELEEVERVLRVAVDASLWEIPPPDRRQAQLDAQALASSIARRLQAAGGVGQDVM